MPARRLGDQTLAPGRRKRQTGRKAGEHADIEIAGEKLVLVAAAANTGVADLKVGRSHVRTIGRGQRDLVPVELPTLARACIAQASGQAGQIDTGKLGRETHGQIAQGQIGGDRFDVPSARHPQPDAQSAQAALKRDGHRDPGLPAIEVRIVDAGVQASVRPQERFAARQLEIAAQVQRRCQRFRRLGAQAEAVTGSAVFEPEGDTLKNQRGSATQLVSPAHARFVDNQRALVE